MARDYPPIQEASQRTRLKIPVIYGIDSIHAQNYVQGARPLYAGDWHGRDVESALMQRAAAISGAETRAAGIPWSFSPCRHGRTFVASLLGGRLAEDPYLATVWAWLSCAEWRANDVSSPNHVATSLKQYMGYSLPLNGRDRTPAWIPENYLRGNTSCRPSRPQSKASARTAWSTPAEI